MTQTLFPFPASLFIFCDDLKKPFSIDYSEIIFFVNWLNCVSHRRNKYNPKLVY